MPVALGPSGQGKLGAGGSARVTVSLPSGLVMPVSVMRPPGVRGPSPAARAWASTSSFVVVAAVSGASPSGPEARARASARAAAGPRRLPGRPGGVRPGSSSGFGPPR